MNASNRIFSRMRSVSDSVVPAAVVYWFTYYASPALLAEMEVSTN